MTVAATNFQLFPEVARAMLGVALGRELHCHVFWSVTNQSCFAVYFYDPPNLPDTPKTPKKSQ
eukprot:4027171-Amphidinium_carterae.1